MTENEKSAKNNLYVICNIEFTIPDQYMIASKIKEDAYISYNEKLKIEKDLLGFDSYVNYDIIVCGNDIIPILLAIKKYSNVDIDKVKRKVNDKVAWYRENCKDDYIRQFGDKEIDIFELYK